MDNQDPGEGEQSTFCLSFAMPRRIQHQEKDWTVDILHVYTETTQSSDGAARDETAGEAHPAFQLHQTMATGPLRAGPPDASWW